WSAAPTALLPLHRVITAGWAVEPGEDCGQWSIAAASTGILRGCHSGSPRRSANNRVSRIPPILLLSGKRQPEECSPRQFSTRSLVKLNWVDGFTVDFDLEVQVRTGGLASITHFSDYLPDFHVLANGNKTLVDVAVNSDHISGVRNPNPHPVPAGRTGTDHLARTGRPDRRSDLVRDVDALVNCAPPGTEPTGDPPRGHRTPPRRRPWHGLRCFLHC